MLCVLKRINCITMDMKHDKAFILYDIKIKRKFLHNIHVCICVTVGYYSTYIEQK